MLLGAVVAGVHGRKHHKPNKTARVVKDNTRVEKYMVDDDDSDLDEQKWDHGQLEI